VSSDNLFHRAKDKEEIFKLTQASWKPRHSQITDDNQGHNKLVSSLMVTFKFKKRPEKAAKSRI